MWDAWCAAFLWSPLKHSAYVMLLSLPLSLSCFGCLHVKIATTGTELVSWRLVPHCHLHAAEHRQQGKFQPFKRLFRKKKKREATADFEEAGIKCSQSTGDVTNGILSDDEETNQHLRWKCSKRYMSAWRGTWVGLLINWNFMLAVPVIGWYSLSTFCCTGSSQLM